jgi:CRISPR system Cascade subunit CasB
MIMQSKPRNTIFNWWRMNLGKDKEGEARALSARLRRAKTMVEALSERAVQELGAELRLGFAPEKLALLTMTLAHVSEQKTHTLAKCFGEVIGQSGEGKQKQNKYKLSESRFQNIVRAENPMELTTQLRRALPIVGNACNVGRLGEDLLFWHHPDIGERIRARWWFDYFGGAMPAVEKDTSEDTLENEEATQ